MSKTFLRLSIIALAIGSLCFAACSDDKEEEGSTGTGTEGTDSEDDNGGGADTGTESQYGNFFISVIGESDSEYVLQLKDVSTGSAIISDNIAQLEESEYYWIFRGNRAVGLRYLQGDPGLALGWGINDEGRFVQLSSFTINKRFTTYGFYDKYAIMISGGNTIEGEDGETLKYDDGTERKDGAIFTCVNLENNFAITLKTLPTYNVFAEGEQATFSGVVDLGDGTFLTGAVVSQAIDESATGGASTGTVNDPDKVWVARINSDFEVQEFYTDDRISYTSGRYRSQYYAQIAKTDDGTVYVFSGSFDSNATNPCGALKMNSSINGFDSDYYFNINAVSSDYRFRKVWYVTGDYFVLEFYNETGVVATTAGATQFAVVNMSSKTLNWINGLPAKENITSIGLPAAYEGKLYLPVVEDSQYPAIYIIDPATAQAEKGISITGAVDIRAIGRIVSE